MAIRSGLIVTKVVWLLDQDLLLQKFYAIRSGLIVTKVWSSRTKLVLKKYDHKPWPIRALFRINSVLQLDNFGKVCDSRARTNDN